MGGKSLEEKQKHLIWNWNESIILVQKKPVDCHPISYNHPSLFRRKSEETDRRSKKPSRIWILLTFQNLILIPCQNMVSLIALLIHKPVGRSTKIPQPWGGRMACQTARYCISCMPFCRHSFPFLDERRGRCWMALWGKHFSHCTFSSNSSCCFYFCTVYWGGGGCMENGYVCNPYLMRTISLMFCF